MTTKKRRHAESRGRSQSRCFNPNLTGEKFGAARRSAESRYRNMPVPELTSQDKRDDKLQLPPPDRVVQIISAKFLISIPHAREVVRLAALDNAEARS
jgi:hypothetical protein